MGWPVVRGFWPGTSKVQPDTKQARTGLKHARAVLGPGWQPIRHDTATNLNDVNLFYFNIYCEIILFSSNLVKLKKFIC
jgi:hypothetical protein